LAPFSWSEKLLVTFFYFQFMFFGCKIRHSFEFVCVLKHRPAGSQECRLFSPSLLSSCWWAVCPFEGGKGNNCLWTKCFSYPAARRQRCSPKVVLCHKGKPHALFGSSILGSSPREVRVFRSFYTVLCLSGLQLPSCTTLGSVTPAPAVPPSLFLCVFLQSEAKPSCPNSPSPHQELILEMLPFRHPNWDSTTCSIRICIIQCGWK
jgi:hypothetical protein